MNKLYIYILFFPLITFSQTTDKVFNSQKLNYEIIEFIKSDDFYNMGKIDFLNLKEQKKLEIDKSYLEIEWGFGGACVDQSEVFIEEIYYYKKNKNLIVHVHYNGDWESSPSDTYLYCFYNNNSSKYEVIKSMDKKIFYNYNNKHFFTVSKDECMWSDYILIYDDNLEPVFGVHEWEDEDIFYDLGDNYSIKWEKNQVHLINQNKITKYIIKHDPLNKWRIIKT